MLETIFDVNYNFFHMAKKKIPIEPRGYDD